jgi:hypothetical protein
VIKSGFGQFALLFATFFIAAPVFAQTDKDDAIQRLLDRVAALEREVSALKQGQAPAAEPKPDATAPQPEAVVASTSSTSTVQDSTPVDNASRFTFHGYADVGFHRLESGSTDTKQFALGELDLFATARMSPRLTALGELVFETDNQTQVAQVPVNIERLLLQFRGSKYFNVEIGSYRAAIGFYSTAFLRGSWLQTALTRPRMFTFEDDGGFLPLHQVGISVNGEVPSGGLGLHYVVETGASRNYGQNSPTNIQFAFNNAWNVAVFARPHAVPGLQIGFSSYRDHFSPLQGMLLNRDFMMVHIVYQGRRLEFLSEGVIFGTRIAPESFVHIPGFYSQLAYRIGSSWTPYVRYEYANATGRNDYGVHEQYVPWRRIWTGGVRYDMTEFAALKFEIAHETSQVQPDWIRAAVQLAFTF